MSIGLKRIGIGALIVTVAVLLGVFRPGVPQDTGEAALFTPGGAAAYPSALPGLPPNPAAVPAFPGMNQQIPAIAPASGPNAMAVAGVFCDLFVCPDVDGDTVAPITFEITRVFPPGNPAASFAGTGTQTLVCQDGATCDMSNTGGAVFVTVSGGGVNEVVRVTGADESGDSRAVTIIFVETIFAVAPVNAASALGASLVSYRCPNVGLIPADTNGDGVTLNDAGDADWENLLEMSNAVTQLGIQFDPLDGVPQYDCGADTALTSDDRVNFETDAGILTVEEAADVGIGTVDQACDAGDSVDVMDGNGGLFFGAPIGSFCDLDWADNGVVTYGLLGTGDVGVATVTAQQSGGGGVLRTINVTFAGAAALSLFIDAPELVGSAGADFNVVLVDQDGRPIAGETVECSVSPTGGALAIIPQTGTSDDNGNVGFQLIPTGASVAVGEELALTCFLDSNPDVRATAMVNLTLEPALEVVDLVAGCNPIASTWPDATAASEIAGAVAPADALEALWAFDALSGTWEGFAPDAPQASDLDSIDMLDAFFACASDAATISRPVI